MKRFHLHLVSDSTGETLEAIAKAALAQFEHTEAIKHYWPMVRTEGHIDRVVADVQAKPGLVLFTIVNNRHRDRLQARLLTLGVPALSVLDPVLEAFGQFTGDRAQGLPGRQHALDAAYFRRIDAVHFTMAHDDGLATDDLADADIVLIGVSRTSKTPTSIYLANRGYKTANIPLVPGIPLPIDVMQLKKPLIVGLVVNKERLIDVRRHRLRSMNQSDDSGYVDEDKVTQELQAARRLFAKNGWPTIDVSRRSIEETAAAVLNLYNQRAEATTE